MKPSTLIISLILIVTFAGTTTATNIAGDSNSLPSDKTFLNITKGEGIRSYLHYSNNTLVESTGTDPQILFDGKTTQAHKVDIYPYITVYFSYPTKVTMLRVYPLSDTGMKCNFFTVNRLTYTTSQDDYRMFPLTSTCFTSSITNSNQFIAINFTNLITPNLCFELRGGNCSLSEIEIYYELQSNSITYKNESYHTEVMYQNSTYQNFSVTNVYQNNTYSNQSYYKYPSYFYNSTGGNITYTTIENNSYYNESVGGNTTQIYPTTVEKHFYNDTQVSLNETIERYYYSNESNVSGAEKFIYNNETKREGIPVDYGLYVLMSIIIVLQVFSLIKKKRKEVIVGKEPKEKVEVTRPLALVDPTIERFNKPVKCGICLGFAKPGSEMIKCRCSSLYHVSCGERASICPKCDSQIDGLLEV